MTKTITFDPVTRIEGHARVTVDIAADGKVEQARLIVNELRGFERILVGMEADRMPHITARICGVCPSAHHLVACKALEAAFGAEVPEAALMQRELLYMGHFIHSHAVSLFVLAGPDLFFGLDGDAGPRNIVGLVAAEPEVAKKALRLRTIGQRINEVVGGRGVHPVTAVIGGMATTISEAERGELEMLADEGLTLGKELGTVVQDRLARQLDKFPALKDKLVAPTAYLALVKDGAVDFYDGALTLMDPEGKTLKTFAAADYDQHIVERAVDWTYLKPVYAKVNGAEVVYRVGPLARLNVAGKMATPEAETARQAFAQRFGRPCHNSVLQIEARIVELLYALEHARRLAADPRLCGRARIEAPRKAGRGAAAVEAPRGVLIHDYEVDGLGIIRSANLIVATQQNYDSINDAIRQAVESFIVGKGEAAILNSVEFAIRAYDPCLSCATHALGRMPLEVEVRQEGELVRRLRRPA